MMKQFIFLIMASISGFSQAQKENVIYATTSKNVNIFFQSPISTAIVGSETFSFGFNREEKSKYGILKAIPGPESNLLVTTENGNIFSFIIQYKKDISNLNYFINDSLSIGNMNGNVLKASDKITLKKESGNPAKEAPQTIEDKTSQTVTVNDYETGSKTDGAESGGISDENSENSYYRKQCSDEIKKGRFYLRFYGQNSNVFVRLKTISYNRDDLYFTLIIDNNSNLDYDVEDLSFYITARKKTKKTSTQQIKYEPVFVSEEPKRFTAHSSKEIVYVFKKFSINNQKILLAALSEFKGERTVVLEIPNTLINNPK